MVESHMTMRNFLKNVCGQIQRHIRGLGLPKFRGQYNNDKLEEKGENKQQGSANEIEEN